jgi:hypothetical protein
MQELLNVKAAGTYSDHSSLKGYNGTSRKWDKQFVSAAEFRCYLLYEESTNFLALSQIKAELHYWLRHVNVCLSAHMQELENH